VRFVADSRDSELLETVIQLKRRQYAATGARDYFRRREAGGPSASTAAHAEVGPSAARCQRIRRPAPAGRTFRPAINGGAALGGFPVYDPKFANLAPGWILLRELVMAGPSMGIHRIDLGRGDDEYKTPGDDRPDGSL